MVFGHEKLLLLPKPEDDLEKQSMCFFKKQGLAFDQFLYM